MGTRKTLIRSNAGVRLHRIERLAGRQRDAQDIWRLTTHRTGAERQFFEEAEAEDAFDQEVIASLCDPMVIEMQRRGLID